MELDVSDTDVMNSDLYKNALKNVKDPRRIQIGQEVEGLGKFGKGDTIFSKVKAQLAAQKAAPVPLPRPADRMPTGTGVRQPTATQVSVPASGLNINQIGQQADNARLSGYRDIQQAGPSTGPAMQPTSMNKPETQMVAGQNVRNDLAGNIPTQVTRPPLGGSPADKFTSLIRGTFGEETQYNVKRGDTLSAIAKRNNTTVDAIAKASGITDPNKLSIGQKVVIPGKMVAPVPLPRPDSRMQTQQEPAAVTMRPSATGTSGVGANVNTGVRQPTATMRPSATGTSGVGVGASQSTQDQQLTDRLAQADSDEMSRANQMANQDQELADRLAQADVEASSQPKTTVNKYVSSLPSPDYKTSVGLENWLNKMRR
jgi:LysM repeat protein